MHFLIESGQYKSFNLYLYRIPKGCPFFTGQGVNFLFSRSFIDFLCTFVKRQQLNLTNSPDRCVDCGITNSRYIFVKRCFNAKFCTKILLHAPCASLRSLLLRIISIRLIIQKRKGSIMTFLFNYNQAKLGANNF